VTRNVTAGVARRLPSALISSDLQRAQALTADAAAALESAAS